MASTVRADVLVEISNGDKVTGSLRPAAEVETFLINVPAGSVLKIETKGKRESKKQTAPVVTFRLFDPADVEVGAASAKTTKTGLKLKLTRDQIPASGQYRIVVTGDGVNEGTYQLKASWNSPKKATFPITENADGGQSLSNFGVDSGARLKSVTVKKARGSGSTPVLQSVAGPDGPIETFDPATTKVKNLDTMVFGQLTLATSGTVAGAYIVKISIKPPKRSKRKIDIRSANVDTGQAGGGQVFGQVLPCPDAGGTIEVDPSVAGRITGSKVVIPPGALSGSPTILIGTAPDIAFPTQDLQSAGPAVFFGPDGTDFAADVTITIPFDAGTFGAITGQLRVFTQDDRGRVSEVTVAVTYDTDAGTASFGSRHFSSYVVSGPKSTAPAGDLDGDGIGDLVLTAPFDSESVGAVFVFPGSSNLTLPATTSSAPIVLTGESPGDNFGCYFSRGNVNGDGREDLMVAAPGAGPGGRVYVFLGGSGFASRSAADADFVLQGAATGDSFGASLAVGFLNDDCLADILVGAPGNGAGKAHIFFGTFDTNPETAFAAPDSTLTGATSGDRFGTSVGIGDVDGDGVHDAVVGADQSGNEGAGAAYVFPGGGLDSPSASDAGVLGLAGESVGDGFGSALAVGDVTGDEIPDVVVGAANNGAGGAVYVYAGGATVESATPVKLTGESEGDEFGHRIAVGDVGGDGTLDVVAASNSSGPSALYVFAGGAGLVSTGAGNAEFRYTIADNGHTMEIEAPSDVNADGVADLIAYDPQAAPDGRGHIIFGGASQSPSGPIEGAANQSIDGGGGTTGLGRRP